MSDLIPLYKFLAEGGPALVFALGLLLVIYKILKLWIMKHYEKMAPLYERQTAAIERLSDTAGKMAENLAQEHRLMGVSLRALWNEWEERKLVGAVNS